MSAFFGPDGDDSTVPLGQMAQASPYGVKDRERCTRDGCTARHAYAGHASGFKHVFRPKAPKPKGLSRVAKADSARRDALAKALERARGDKEPYPQGVLLPSRAKGLTVYSRTPWAWKIDRSGMPVPAKSGQ